MNALTRRHFLRNTAAAGAVGATIAAPAVAEATVAATATELPVTRVNRLAWELSRAMDDWCADIGTGVGPDAWKAHVYPASYTSYPVGFEHLSPALYPVDPLLEAIRAFRKQIAIFNAQWPDDDEADALAEVTYKVPMAALEEWSTPALTKEGATEALRLAHEETAMFQASPMVQPLLRAALAYLDGEAQRRES